MLPRCLSAVAVSSPLTAAAIFLRRGQLASREGISRTEGFVDGRLRAQKRPARLTPSRPLVNASDRTRTCNLRFRRPMLYPIEPRTQISLNQGFMNGCDFVTFQHYNLDYNHSGDYSTPLFADQIVAEGLCHGKTQWQKRQPCIEVPPYSTPDGPVLQEDQRQAVLFWN